MASALIIKVVIITAALVNIGLCRAKVHKEHDFISPNLWLASVKKNYNSFPT